MRAIPALLAIAATTLLMAGCGGEETTHESLAGTPAAIHVVKDVEAMARACERPGRGTRRAAIQAYTDLARITSIHPRATFGPEDGEVTMRRLLHRAVEKTGRCIGVSVDARGRYHVD